MWIPTGERSGLQTRIAATESVSLCVSISSKLPLCDSRIGDNVKKRGWSLGWVLSGAGRVSKENFLFFQSFEIQPNKRDESLSCRR